MAWKKKERPLTLEEAILQAQRSVAPYWRGSEPLFSAFPKGESTPGEAQFFSLSPSFQKKMALLVFFDPFDFLSGSVWATLEHFYRKYATFDVLPMAVLTPRFAKLRESAALAELPPTSAPSVMDWDGSIQNALQVVEAPAFVLLQNNQVLFQGQGPSGAIAAEQHIHDLLRKTDPGLPLRPIADLKSFGKWDSLVLPLNQATPKLPNAELVKLSIGGNWQRTDDCLIALDRTAELRITFKCRAVGIVTGMPVPSYRGSRVIVDLKDPHLFDESLTKNIQKDESAKNVIWVKSTHHYTCLENVHDLTIDLGLQFSAAETDLVHVYGFTFLR